MISYDGYANPSDRDTVFVYGGCGSPLCGKEYIAVQEKLDVDHWLVTLL